MKQTIGMIWIFVFLIGYWIYPKQEKVEQVYQQAIEPYSYQLVINGEVCFPGTYTFYEEKTIQDIISYAGGFLNQADLESVRLNDTINQNTSITIKSKKKEETPIQKININEASFSMLLDLPYMTESRAAAIILYREQYGDFLSIEDLVLVKYIGNATLENLRPYIEV